MSVEVELDIDGSKLFSSLANQPEVVAQLESIAAAKTAQINAEIQAASNGGNLHSGAVYEIRQARLANSFPFAAIHTTSRGAYAIAASHGIMRW